MGGMKAAVYRGRNDVRVEDIPAPSIGAGEILLQVKGCGVCGTDLKKIAHGYLPPPLVFGHEVAGQVAAVGAGVAGWKIGDRAATPGGRGADFVIEAVGQPAAWSQAIAVVRPGGRALLFGGCPAGTQIPLDTKRIHYDELTLLSVFHHTPDAIRESLKLIADGIVKPELLITDTAPLEDLPAILRRMLTQQDGVKTAIHP